MVLVKNTGSAARDFLANERNFLSFCRLCLLLSLLSSSFLLLARIPSEHQDKSPPSEPGRLPFGTLYFLSGVCVMLLGVQYYFVTIRRLTAGRAFLHVTNSQAAAVTIGASLIFVTCIVLLVDDDL